MIVEQIMSELEALGSPGIKKILAKHGVKEPFFGVKVGDMKPIEKKIKKDYNLAKGLFATGNADAMYLAGLIADDLQMTREELQQWVSMAESNNISEYTVPWVTAGSRYGYDLALEWIESEQEHIAAAGWATLSNLVTLKPDADLKIPELKKLISRVEKKIHHAMNRERHTMNGFLISVGVYVKDLTDFALEAAATIGPVTVNMNGTACKEPNATEYIKKAIAKGQHGKKKKTVKC